MASTPREPPAGLSIVVPFHNEEGNVAELHRRLGEVLAEIGAGAELVYVDDGSTDGTRAEILALAGSDPRVTAVLLRGNYGQTGALAAGFDIAGGEIVVSMDGDLQHDPADLPALLAGIDEGYDIVSGWRKERVDPYWRRKLPSRVANWAMARMTGIRLHDFGTTYKAYRRHVLQEIRLYGQLHRFIPVLAAPVKPRIKEVPIRSLPRLRGSSKYSLARTTTVFFDLIRLKFLTHYMSRPLQVFGTAGLACGGAGLAVFVYLALIKLATGMSIIEQRGPLFLTSILLMIVGSQLFTLGLIGELVVKVYHDIAGRRPYSIERVVRGRPDGAE